MWKKLESKGVQDNALFAFAVFIAFLILFEGELAIPTWLRPVGRMHAMVVHFPIVLILLAAVLEVVRFYITDESTRFYSVFTKQLLFVGALLSGVTVVMGIFLAREEGYDTQAVVAHKWAGVVVFYSAVLLFAVRDRNWFGVIHARAAAVLLVGCVLVVGHLGGSLTHGENYVWQPIATSFSSAAAVSVDTLAFDDIVKPILESRCRSCHNPLKNKGNLLLTDSVTMARGGKSGPLFLSGNPEESLILQRIALPLDEKKHMPPSEKPQLTDEEKNILYQWVKSGAPFQRRVTTLPESDSFRLLAIQMLEKRSPSQRHFDFPPAPSETLARLNSNYRVIRPVSRNSPAVAVNVYNHSLYSSSTIEELGAIREQVVTLDLSNMPVADEDIPYIARLRNVRRLNLNFTSVTGSGLARLGALRYLEYLSIAGTSVSYTEVNHLLTSLPALKSLALWETLLTDAEIATLQRDFPHVRILGAREGEIEMIRLNSPRMANKTRVFDDSIILELIHPVRGTEIRYTIDGTEPDSVSSPLYNGRLVLARTTSVKAKAFKKDWISSEVAMLNVYRSAHEPDTAILLSRLNRVHVQKGAPTFFDHELGTFNANSPAWANNWGGVRNNPLALLLRYDVPRTIGQVSLNCLVETETGIFPPEAIEVWGGDSPDDMRLIGRKRIELPSDYQKPYIQLFDCPTDSSDVTYVKILAAPVMKFPAWHRNAGRPALLLVDEILVN